MVKKNAFVTLVEDGKADFLQGATVTGVGTTAVGSPRERGIGFNSAHNQEKWGFLAKEQGEGSADGQSLRVNITVRGDSA